MGRRLRSQLSFANVVSVIALCVAVGLGTAWALERNSVESKHIAPNAVRGSDTLEASLSGFKCDQGTRYHAGACIETTARSADDWAAADSDCIDEEGRLPTSAELLTFRHTSGITLSGGNEWSHDYWRDADDGAAENFYSRGVADAGTTADAATNQDLQYRCAFAPK